VNEGDIVRKGQVIGYLGTTGFSTGPHLHWEMRIYKSPVNPEYFLETDLDKKFEKVVQN
jgi:murein DD-endopeptidase MepM/ murein hydrolase activator NlpD